MRTTVKLDACGRPTARRWQPLMIAAFSSAVAMRYCLAAQRDESNGFPLTAAMEWRKAAELLAPVALIADRCWREWERIMRLPRHLAGPIGRLNAAPHSSPRPDTMTVAAEVPVFDTVPLAPAA